MSNRSYRRLVRLKVDLIAAIAAAIQAAKAATTVTPIVMFTNYSVGTRFVASLAHPGGNITGVLIPPEGTLVGKRLELLKEAVPRAGRIAVQPWRRQLPKHDPGGAEGRGLARRHADPRRGPER